MTVFYKKVGRKYVPVSEYDSDLHDGFPEGSHLVVCRPGITTRKYNIDPNYAALIAASIIAHDAISSAIVKASEPSPITSPVTTPLTVKQRKAWEKLRDEMGDGLGMIQHRSANDIAKAGVGVMIEEANKIMENPNAKEAYDYFMLVSKMTQ